ncbi:hypothetical protein [Mesorhizobium sp. B2-3-10]|uniref:hypothetical protein n=1 Tax=Mesorhizobium sp. B2-3-10 TaxID=2589954 RepID=UPI00112B896E|nr:hypothetical protein [Mesorhizobium sp. B2-3-10]TPL94766.1 hypothetical protein FJ943_25105 [Mesorhizobium sp. B2-3-10]
MRVAATILLGLMAMNQASAQTADETILYLLSGLRSEPALVEMGLPGERFRMEPLTDGRVGYTRTYHTDKVDVPSATYQFIKTDDCHYDAKITSYEGKAAPYTPVEKAVVELDFSKVHGISERPRTQQYDPHIVSFDGLAVSCKPLAEKGCEGVLLYSGNEIGWLHAGDKPSIEKALGYFQSTYCKGSAF